ncbi:MAG TPA: serine/threonine-protein kinase [Polyangiaceae bacterium]|nr:serine/threonine-protein kinase [Polyangiaceae bacterium]
MPNESRDERAHARVGSVLNQKWTLERLIGIGGMAAVYAGLHRNGARAAVKVLHADIARIPQVRERFLREGYAANRVDHPGAVKVLDDDVIASGPDEGAAYIVMELLRGGSLEDRLQRGPPIGEQELLGLARAMLGVLEAAHAHGVVHRDLKPENLFIPDPEPGEDPKAPRVKILDFGLARVADARLRTMHGLAVGTPSYMPPEQAAGRVDEIDGRADLFALGATCFRILAGRTVHPGRSPIEIALRMAKEPAPKLRTVAPGVSEATAEVIDRALEFRREDRWPDAAAMRAAVDVASAKRARTAAPRRPAAVPPPAPIVARAATSPARTLLRQLTPRRSRLPLVTVAFLVLVGAKVAQEDFAGHEQAALDAGAATDGVGDAAAAGLTDGGPSR